MNIDETYTATVTANDDPEQRGRIRCSCVGLMGDEDGDMPMWIEPEFQWGWFIVPDVGEQVEVTARKHGDGDDVFGQSSLEGMNVRWRGARHWTSEDAEEPRDVPEDFKTNYGKRRGFATPQGHVLLFDDTENKERITITWHGVRDGVDQFSFFSIDEDGSLVMSNRNGSLMYFNAADEQVTLVDEHGNSFTTDADGMRMIDNHGNIIEMADGVVQIISQGNIVATGADFTAETGSYNLGTGAAFSPVWGEPLVTWLNTHTHPTPIGPTLTPLVPLVPSAVLSVVGRIA